MSYFPGGRFGFGLLGFDPWGGGGGGVSMAGCRWPDAACFCYESRMCIYRVSTT